MDPTITARAREAQRAYKTPDFFHDSCARAAHSAISLHGVAMEPQHHEHETEVHMIRNTLLTLLLGAGAAQAQPMPPPGGPHGGPSPHGAPSPEALATVPGLDAAQQVEVRRILLERRDAHDGLRAKEDAERMALQTRYRAEHEKIDDDASARLRKLLGDEGYRNLAAWLAPDRHGPGTMHPPGPPTDESRAPGAPRVGDNAPPAAAPIGPDTDDAP
jgi:hypothetical protein